MSFSTKLKALMAERGLTQKAFAAEMSIAVSTLGGYAQGTSEPDFATLVRIANYFDVSTDYLLDVNSSTKFTEKEEEILRVFRSLLPEQKELFLEQGKLFIRLNEKNSKL